MKAAIYETYGGPEVLRITEIPKPKPKAGEICVRVHATTVTAGDVRMRSFSVPKGQWLFARLYLGILKPRRQVLGMELSGTVEAVGKNVTRFRTGDRVYAATMHAGFGAYAEYKCLPENGAIALIPEQLTFAEAATLPIGGGTALRFLRKAGIRAGQRVLIYGASGSVGTYAVQLARAFGADVTAVCSTANLALVQEIGANRAIDYTTGNFAAEGPVYDIVFDAVGKADRTHCRQALKKNGQLVSVAGNAGKLSCDDLAFLNRCVGAGQLKPVVEKAYALEEIVAAHRFTDSGRKKGNVVVLVRKD